MPRYTGVLPPNKPGNSALWAVCVDCSETSPQNRIFDKTRNAYSETIHSSRRDHQGLGPQLQLFVVGVKAAAALNRTKPDTVFGVLR